MATPALKQVPRISATRPADHSTMAYRIMLNPSLNDRPDRREWVTHLQTLPDRGKNHGHYFHDYQEAYDDYIARCIKAQVDPRDTDAEHAELIEEK